MLLVGGGGEGWLYVKHGKNILVFTKIVKYDMCAMCGVYGCDRHVKGGMGHWKCKILDVSYDIEHVKFLVCVRYTYMTGS